MPYKITVIGAGFVGLVTAACLAAKNHEVTCIDKDTTRLDTIKSGHAPFHEPGLEKLLPAVSTTNSYGSCAEADIIFIAVGTPTIGQEISLGAVQKACETIGESLKHHKGFPVIVTKSTVLPGTTDGLVRQTLEASSGKTAGKDFGLCMNPEFLQEGRAVEDFETPDRIVLGCSDPQTEDIMKALYGPYNATILTMTPYNAELCKYANNCLLATLISFANEFAQICEHYPNTDIDDVMDAVTLDKRLAPGGTPAGITSYLRAGIGYGGSCLPKDTLALKAFGQKLGLSMPLLSAAISINQGRAAAMVSRIEEVLGSLKNKKIGILGLAFKPGTDDLRESPSLILIEKLKEKGTTILAYDPLIKTLDMPNVQIAQSIDDIFQDSDAVAIATAWPEFVKIDWSQLTTLMSTKLVIDGRSLLKNITLPEDVIYMPIGKTISANTLSAAA